MNIKYNASKKSKALPSEALTQSKKIALAIKNFDYAGTFLMAAIGTVTITLVLLGVIAMGELNKQNPSFEPKKADPETITQMDVDVAEQKVLHRFSENFGKAADFNKKELCDVNISFDTALLPATGEANNGITPKFTPKIVEKLTYSNCISFNKATTRKAKAELKAMRSSLTQKQEAASTHKP